MNAQGSSWLDTLKDLIPGYGAYRNQEERRSDDRRTREYAAKRLGDCMDLLEKLASDMVSEGNLDAPLQVERLRMRLDHAQAKLLAAVEGYAAWFSEKTVDENVLTQVAEHDANLISLIDQIDASIRGDKTDRLKPSQNLLRHCTIVSIEDLSY